MSKNAKAKSVYPEVKEAIQKSIFCYAIFMLISVVCFFKQDTFSFFYIDMFTISLMAAVFVCNQVYWTTQTRARSLVSYDSKNPLKEDNWKFRNGIIQLFIAMLAFTVLELFGAVIFQVVNWLSTTLIDYSFNPILSAIVGYVICAGVMIQMILETPTQFIQAKQFRIN